MYVNATNVVPATVANIIDAGVVSTIMIHLRKYTMIPSSLLLEDLDGSILGDTLEMSFVFVCEVNVVAVSFGADIDVDAKDVIYERV